MQAVPHVSAVHRFNRNPPTHSSVTWVLFCFLSLQHVAAGVFFFLASHKRNQILLFFQFAIVFQVIVLCTHVFGAGRQHFSVFAVCDVTGSMVDIVHNMTLSFIFIYILFLQNVIPTPFMEASLTGVLSYLVFIIILEKQNCSHSPLLHCTVYHS